MELPVCYNDSLKGPVVYKFYILLLILVLYPTCIQQNGLSYQAVVISGYSGTPAAITDGMPTFATIKEALTR